MNVVCNNCGVSGHLIHKCKLPIMSYGVIAYDILTKKYLMICRSNSFGYIEIILGNYTLNNLPHLQILIDEMSIEEKNNLLILDFNTLWSNLWCKKVLDEKSKKKFLEIKTGVIIDGKKVTLEDLITQSETKWETPEWEFPKGRKNYNEKIIECAIREFSEETGYDFSDIKIIENVLPFEEIFVGSNIKIYKHKYFLAVLRGTTPKHKFQASEISQIEWKTIDECIASIRYYNYEKIDMIKNIQSLIENYEIII